jgi:DNA primase
MPFIKQDFIKDLQDKVDIVSTINKRVKLTQKGNNYKACCPFHQEKTPSFNVSATKQAYYCFGCGAHGHLIDFVMNYDNLNFVDAVEKIADENGITIEYDKFPNQEQSQQLSKNKQLIALSEEVANFYKQQLKQAVNAIEYAKNRGINGEIAKRFGLGFAPKNWQNLVNAFKNSTQQKQLLDLSLIKKNDKGNYYDLFVDRLIFPITNHKSEVIAFGGRTLDPDGKPKYLNSPASEIFDKSATLYGLDIARKYSDKLDYLLIVEGYMDVVSLHQAGITKVVATLGTATTTSHIEILKRNTTKIIFCFDGDVAGKNAATKALNIILPLISANIEVNFLFMPDGKDPDDVVKSEGKLAFEKRIQGAKKLSEFLFSSQQGSDFNTIEGKTKFIDNTLDLINLVQYPTYKTQLTQGLADIVGQNVESLKKSTLANKPNPPSIPIIQTQEDKVLQSQLAKITTIILNYPDNLDNQIITKIREIVDNKLINQILEEIEFSSNANYFDLLKQFKAQEKIYNRLFALAKNNPKLTPDDAKKELETILNTIIKRQEKIKRLQKINELANKTTNEKA